MPTYKQSNKLGFIDKDNYDRARKLLHDLGITYESNQYGWGFKFKARLKPETYKDIIAHLKPEDNNIGLWPISSELRNITQQSQIQPYFDFVTITEINRNIISQYTLKNRIPTHTPNGYPCIEGLEINTRLMNLEYVKIACEGIANSPRGNYKQALADAANKTSHLIQTAKDNSDENENRDRTINEDLTLVALYKAMEKQLDLLKEKYPPPFFSVTGMNMKTLENINIPKPGLTSTARQIINPARLGRG
jgi:hypothetical protein